MSQKEMKAFLKAEGWYPRIHPITGATRSRGWMVDPHTWDSWGWGLVKEAYRVAKRRKANRETALLKASGWHFRCSKNMATCKLPAGWVHSQITLGSRFTKEDALLATKNGWAETQEERHG